MSRLRRIAAWCCPRTCSTALLRSFVERADVEGVDEPLYAYYLAWSGKQHPMREEVLASQSPDFGEVVEKVVLGPCAAPVHYQKHMPHHLRGDEDLGFVSGLRNFFLVREPREMLPSLADRIGTVEARDTGFPQMLRLFRQLREAGEPVAVVDSRDVLDRPEPTLRALCGHLGIAFDPAMLSWLPGRHAAYGVWAAEWYRSLETSTGFRPHVPKDAPLTPELQRIRESVQPAFDELHAARLRPADG